MEHTVLARSRFYLRSALLIAAILSTATSLRAQTAIRGVVRDELGQPIAGAEVVVGSSAHKVVTDADGRFVVASVYPGVGYFTARAPGALPTADLLRFSSVDSLDIRLERFSDSTDSVKQHARAEKSLTRVVALYAAASASARTGVAFTARDIAQRSTAYTTDLFREIVGFRIVGEGQSANVYTANGRCAPTIMMNGRERPNMSVNEIAPSSIKLLVAYNAYAVLPPDLRVFRVNPACGLVSVTSK